ncbi:MAG: hypothetical protein DRJ60_04805, partial [Thermoprotei archaeon]
METEVWDSYPKRGKRGCDFHYVKEESSLYHISNYATSKERTNRDVCYKVPLNKLRGKWIYIFGRTNNGYPVFWKTRSEDLASNERKYIDVSNEELENLRLGDYSPRFNSYVEKNWNYIVDMVRSFKQSEVFKKSKYTFAHPGVECFLKHGLGCGYWWCASWPDDRKRRNSLKEEMKYIHQCWIFSFMIDCLGLSSVLSPLRIAMGWREPAVVFEDEEGRVWSGWIEPQIVMEAPPEYEGPKTLRRFVWKRADIMFAKGDWRRKGKMIGLWYTVPDDLKNPDLLVECKHDEFHEWWDEHKV